MRGLVSTFVLSACIVFGAADAESRLLVIGGTVVTPERVIPHGWVTIRNGIITAIAEKKPKRVRGPVLDTTDIIFPGFVDLHNHPLYNVFPRWEPPHLYADRYEWRNDPIYNQDIQTPERTLIDAEFCDVDEFVEVKALAGGTTSLLGISKPYKAPTMPACIEGLARNLDWYTGFNGKEPGHEPVTSLVGVTPKDLSDARAAELKAGLATGAIKLLTIHVAEGRPDDPESKSEFKMVEDRGFLTPETAIIHGVALSPADYSEMHKIGAPLIWSPRSNMELYGQSADLAAAKSAGVTIALAPDWSPTGSTGMLAELDYAAHFRAPGAAAPAFTPKQLFEMATIVPARIAHLDDKLGSITVGKHADLFLLHGDAADPYTAVTNAPPQAVSLTLVDGVPLYGDRAYLSTLGIGKIEAIDICGQPRGLNSAALPDGPFKDADDRIAAKLQQSSIAIGPLAECTLR
jgi:5-methylthioadenosine/S-adenosylhomocysteine deaminase